MNSVRELLYQSYGSIPGDANFELAAGAIGAGHGGRGRGNAGTGNSAGNGRYRTIRFSRTARLHAGTGHVALFWPQRLSRPVVFAVSARAFAGEAFAGSVRSLLGVSLSQWSSQPLESHPGARRQLWRWIGAWRWMQCAGMHRIRRGARISHITGYVFRYLMLMSAYRARRPR